MEQIVKKKRQDPEHQEQAKLINDCNLAAEGMLDGWPAIPELAKVYSVPNGGKRGKREAGKLKNEGVKSGRPDLALDVARGGFFGLRIEMKAPGKIKDTSKNQKAVLNDLIFDGYFVAVCDSWSMAWDVLIKYLAKGETTRGHFKAVTPDQERLRELIDYHE